jgi:hypothetical protein
MEPPKNESESPSVDLSLNCALCWRSFPASQMPLRGKLNFCQACATERAEECLARLNAYRKKSPWAPVGYAMLGLGLIAAAAACWAFGIKPSTTHTPSALQKILTAVKTGSAELTESESESDSKPISSPVTPPAPVNSAAAAPVAEAKETSTPWLQRLLSDRNRRAVEDAGSIHLLFVIRPGTDTRMGLASLLFITREAPNDNSAKLTTEVGSQMQTSFDEGLRYVRKQPRNWEREFSIRLSFEDKFTSKDGGSAGTGFTIAMLSAIKGVPLDSTVAVTGDLTVDGTVQPVGAVVDKIRGALEEKCKVILIPERNSRDVTDLAILDGTQRLWETQIFSISTIDEAFNLARKDRPENIKNAMARFDALRARLPAVVTPNYLQSPIVQTELKEIVRAAPNHLSAAALLHAAENQLPHELSLNRSVEEIFSASYLFVSDVVGGESTKQHTSNGPGLTVFPEREFNVCINTLQRLSPILDHRSQDLRLACMAYASAIHTAATYQPPDMRGYRTYQQWTDLAKREKGLAQQTKEEVDERRSRLLLALHKLDTDGSLISELKKK